MYGRQKNRKTAIKRFALKFEVGLKYEEKKATAKRTKIGVFRDKREFLYFSNS